MPIRGKHHPKWAGLSAVTARKDEVKLMDAQSTLKWFRQDKKQLQALCAGLLSRDSFNTQKNKHYAPTYKYEGLKGYF